MNVLRSLLEKGNSHLYIFLKVLSPFIERLQGFKPKKLAYLCRTRLKPYSIRFLAYLKYLNFYIF